MIDVSGHPLLSVEAAQLDPQELAAQASVAQRVLGITGLRFSGGNATLAAHAVALQVNYQVSIPEEDWAVQSQTRGPRSVTYRSTPDGLPPKHPLAEAIVDGIVEEEVTVDGGIGGWKFVGPRR